MSATKALTSALIQSLLPFGTMFYKGTCTNIDTCWTAGVYTAAKNVNTQNFPSGAYEYGMLIVFMATTGNIGVQIYISDTGVTDRPIYMRIQYGDSQVRGWATIARTLI